VRNRSVAFASRDIECIQVLLPSLLHSHVP
jgi:hypothetical protein